MNKDAAAEKIAKLRRISDDPRTNPSEAANARKTAERLAKEHNLTQDDLDIGKMCSAYDDLVGKIEQFVSKNPNMPVGIFGAEKIVSGVVGKLRQTTDTNKATRLRTVVTFVRTASLFVGDNRYVSEIKTITETALRNNGVTI